MQVKESDSHLLFEEVVVQGKRRKLGPPAEDTCGKQVTRQCQKEARSHSPEDCNSSLRMHQETTRGPMDVGCQEAGPTEWPKLSERKKNYHKKYAVNRKPWQLGTT